VVSSRLEPGVDPIVEAQRRGSILLVIRLGNIDLEAPNTPAMDAPSPYQPKPVMPRAMMNPGMGPGMPRPGPMVPYGTPPGQPMMMGPNGPMMMMGPNGPVLLGPGDPQTMGPGGPMMANPALRPGPVIPPPPPSPPPTLGEGKGGGAAPAATTPPESSGAPTTPVSKQETKAAVELLQYQPAVPAPTAAQLATQPDNTKPATENKDAHQRRWWFGSKSANP